MRKIELNEVFGLIRPDIDAHTLGISAVGKLIQSCGIQVVIGNAKLSKALSEISKVENISFLKRWILENKVTRLGFSYRLDPKNAQLNFGRIYRLLADNQLLADQGGPIEAVYFAGLPQAGELILKEYLGEIPVFIGDETQLETLKKLGVAEELIPVGITENTKYDDLRMDFAKDLILSGTYSNEKPQNRSGYKEYGTSHDRIEKRVDYNRSKGGLPLIRVHVGPYDQNYQEAKKLFLNWLKQLSGAGFLDIVSIGSSQLTQSDFGEDWGNRPNGGGVPINSERDLQEIYQASRPMLTRCYSSTKNVPLTVPIFENNLNMAWHALSIWWFNVMDGRGPNPVKENIHQHLAAIKEIAKSGKPFEPNIPHHFSFRGGDDFSYILSAYLVAITAKKIGVRTLILQTMLNTPKYTWGVQDLAKSRALLLLVRELEDSNFRVIHQPRAGLDYFSPDLEKAKAQLASVTAMMDDIDLEDQLGPDIIHVVSYCEAVQLADPLFINESIQITFNALKEYRKAKSGGFFRELGIAGEVEERTQNLIKEVKDAVRILQKNIKMLYSAEGLYEVFHRGVLVSPYLWECREEFSEAIKWQTGMVNGGVQVIDEQGFPIPTSARLHTIFNG